MNQKDYDAIAEIIRINATKGWVALTPQAERVLLETEEKLRKMYAIKLADYFEKHNFVSGDKKLDFPFNRKDFLKKCGVELKSTLKK